PIEEINSKLLDAGIIGGYDLEKVSSDLKGHMLIAVTEKRTKSEIDKLAKELGDHMQTKNFPLIFERSKTGRTAYALSETDIPTFDIGERIGKEFVREE